jgi:3-dehydroquinate synthase II
LEKPIWIDTSKAPDSGARKKLILAALEGGFGHIVVPSADKLSNRYGKFHLITAGKDCFTIGGEEIAKLVRISGKSDEKKAADLAKGGGIVVVETSDWRVIPLENLIVQFAKSKAKLFVRATTVDDARLFLQTMERGADGIVFTPSSASDIASMARLLDEASPKIDLVDGFVTKIIQLGLGDRVCIDTCSMLNEGEGVLVGNSAQGMFLIHAETFESEYVSSRPFRVNAGAVHAYTLLPDGNTKYLSELRAGDEVLVVDSSGNSRPAVVGRLKIERRPLLLIEARAQGMTFTTMVQNAETIRLVSGKKSISVTDIQTGDKVALRIEEGGRHFGGAVKETIREKGHCIREEDGRLSDSQRSGSHRDKS